ncbi:Tfp pilus assembly protein PilF [Cylindrospermum stagnale PCC 7417]|uniref:Tfp pilus assembly protein PilF n=1 Tax=Cylindrospermum stagnale PCC 7417 TaxID=56107 RepID=K9X379_9NOST|nr:tetratricopeptide repeat protein [Cylindrospermum stagnale]AFZ26549.1 Tfp pilus assembly protein PilF [Cylindrospermum stagnale PCC 7417]
MEWDDFLATEAATHGLSPEQTEAFLIRLNKKNSGKGEAKLAVELNIDVTAFKKRMTQVYDKFAQSCPELANSHRGKLEKLRAWLTAKYNGVENTPPTIKETHHNLPPAVPSERFVGREEELQKLHQQLQTSQQVAIVAVEGMGGVGKTELATQYAKQHLQNYPGGVCWLSAQGIDVGIQILRFAELKFNIIAPDDWELIDRVKFCCEKWEPGEVLLVFDNVTDYKQVQCYQPESPRFKLLLTTRFEFDSTLQQLPLGVLKPLAAMKLLKLLVGRERLQNEAWFARKICKFLGYLPLALELVGRYLMKMPDLSLETLWKRLDKKRLEHEAIAKANPLMLYQYGVAEAFELSWEKLDEKAQGLGCWLSLYALADIPYSVEGMEDDEEQELLEKAIRDLRELHLIERINKGIYRLHPLIRQFFQMKLDESSNADEVKTAFVAEMLEIGEEIPQQPTLDVIQKLTPFIPHLAEVANDLSEYISDENLMIPFTKLGWFYQGQCFYEQAEPWLEKCIEVIKNRLGSEHCYFAISSSNLALLYQSQGRYKEAKQKFQQALELSKYWSVKDEVLFAIILDNLAVIFYLQGQYKEAEAKFQQALEIFTTILGDENTRVANTLNHLAQVYQTQDNYSKAGTLLKQVLEMRKNLQGENHPDFAQSLNNLAAFYASQGDYIEAQTLCWQALKMKNILQGENHPDVALILTNIGVLYFYQKSFNEAEALLKQALEMRKCLHGETHPDIANSLNHMALFYSGSSRYDEAEPLFKKALEIRKSLLSENHPDIATSLYNLARLYTDTGCYTKAKSHYQEPLVIYERTLGVGHSRTMNVRESYAIFLEEVYR